MYQFIQTFHSHNRNIIFLVIAIVLVLSIIGIIQKKPWSKIQKIVSLVFMIVIDIQATLGLILYFGFSNSGIKAFSNPNINVMKNDAIRKIAVEHLILMLLAWILVHIGYSKIKNSSNPNKSTLIYYGLSILLILLGIPWDRIL